MCQIGVSKHKGELEMSKKEETSLRNLIYHTEQTVWKAMTLEHRGYRTALWKLISEHIYAVGDYYVPADELFFGTSALADEVLETVIGIYDFKNPKKIIVIQPRYQSGDKYGVFVEIPEYLNKNKESELLYIAGNKFRVVVSEQSDDIVVAIFN